MTRSLLLLIFIAGFYACAMNKHQQKRSVNSKNVTIISLFPEISFDTLNVFSWSDVDDPKYKYKGILLDSTRLKLFPEYLNFTYEASQPMCMCYRFKLDKINTGLIMRTFSEYVSSKIQLFIYDQKMDSIYYERDLAENFGDGGEVFLQESWLYFSTNKKIMCFTEETNLYYNSVDNPADTSVEHSSYYKLVELLSPDTIRTIDKNIINRFKGR